MLVYVVTIDDWRYDDRRICGIFSTRERAEEATRKALHPRGGQLRPTDPYEIEAKIVDESL